MRNYDVILLDLDGTLTDSAPGILNSVRYACRKLGLPIPGEETLRRFLGPPLIASFRELMGLDAADADRLQPALQQRGEAEVPVRRGDDERVAGGELARIAEHRRAIVPRGAEPVARGETLRVQRRDALRAEGERLDLPVKLRERRLREPPRPRFRAHTGVYEQDLFHFFVPSFSRF